MTLTYLTIGVLTALVVVLLSRNIINGMWQDFNKNQPNQ